MLRNLALVGLYMLMGGVLLPHSKLQAAPEPQARNRQAYYCTMGNKSGNGSTIMYFSPNFALENTDTATVARYFSQFVLDHIDSAASGTASCKSFPPQVDQILPASTQDRANWKQRNVEVQETGWNPTDDPALMRELNSAELQRASSDLISTINEYGDFNTDVGSISVHYKVLAATWTGACTLEMTEEPMAESDTSYSGYVLTETTPLAQVDADSIDYKLTEAAGFKGWAYSFKTIDNAEVIRHEENQGSLHSPIISHLTSTRYFAETQDSAKRISQKLAEVVKLCQATQKNQ